ncbi:hypothetical protein [Shewanella kaireitica]|uniref:hypothetical protein n=1 Tax=Shewanella kaireitica TaxID=212021 RepID=UPI00200DFDBF|nr:hypothetical protein [Shewanella kaireitica]MCL1093658.1 hypothetical protein [Shewanella kaireitica]
MSKLFKLKQYLTVEEAAKYLSSSIEEPVSLADLYRLVLDKHLTMSVRLNSHAYAKGGQYITPQYSDSNSFQVENNLATNEALDEPYQINLDDELLVGENRWLAFDEQVHVIDGVWDLAMIGLESYEIEKLYQKEVGGTEPTLDAINDFFLKRDDFIFRIQTSLQLEGNQYNLAALETKREQLLRANGLSRLDFNRSNNSLVLDCLSADDLDDFMTLNEALIPYENGKYPESDSYFELDKPNYQFVITIQDINQFTQSLEDTLQEIKPLVQQAYTKNYKQAYNKAQTQTKYSKWQRQANKLKKANPDKSKTWVAIEIAKLPIAEGKSAETIRKNIKI